ncbi:zinc-binding alcohol dehydrogenase family protein [Pseudonocardia sp. ICBG1293]|uniref:quinone oxidoreductase family protein n=1 Tax=Pseudonocardia sp. ICBG1293 TaxID=2844382 RepID=UPI001CCA4EA3|nr:zinc-binding alcohol dehydrogenase family protein [Pseudonocardia sp. ICBG1293]
MKAAVVTSFATAPACADFPVPGPGAGTVVVRMLAAGVHQLVRSVAAGSHYSAGDRLPFVAGVDGIAELDGRRVYTGGCPAPYGTIAERTLVPAGWTVPVPDALSTELAAAVVNPAMSSWMPLADRGVPAGGTVLVLGATGASGSLAVRIALHHGAGRVIAAGRDPAALERVCADDRVVGVRISDDPTTTTAALLAALDGGPDLVLDYLWGPVAGAAFDALRADSLQHGGRAVRYVQIGSLAGRTVELDAAILRARRIEVTGSGGGSIDPALLFAELPRLLDAVVSEDLDVPLRVADLADVERAWSADGPGRLVIATG